MENGIVEEYLFILLISSLYYFFFSLFTLLYGLKNDKRGNMYKKLKRYAKNQVAVKT